MSTDNSVEIAKRLIGNKGKVIELKQKRLNGGARNEGYLHLSDDVDYVCYLDSDDWYIDNKVLEEINNSLISQPDVLFIGLSEFKGGKTKESIIPCYINKYEALQGWSGSCGKVIKKELATRQDCLYAEGTLKEDKNQHCKICINMKTFELLQRGVYVWNKDNHKSVTTIRDNLWFTSTIRHYADTLLLYLTYKGADKKLDDILKRRVDKTRLEVEMGEDRQW